MATRLCSRHIVACRAISRRRSNRVPRNLEKRSRFSTSVDVLGWGRNFIRRDEHAECALISRGSLLERPPEEVTGIVFVFTVSVETTRTMNIDSLQLRTGQERVQRGKAVFHAAPRHEALNQRSRACLQRTSSSANHVRLDQKEPDVAVYPRHMAVPFTVVLPLSSVALMPDLVAISADLAKLAA